MTNNEKIQKAEQLIAEANALLNEVKTNSNEEDVIAKYKNDYNNKGKQYYLNNYSNVDFIIMCESFERVEELSQSPYQRYLTKELAEQAKKLKDFNDKLLAFKYCYDLDYKPDLHNPNGDKWLIYFDIRDGVYKYLWDNDKVNVVYFSSKEIAQKCADWLNSISE